MSEYEKIIPIRISLDEILKATDDFGAEVIGEGGFGKVYKAQLPSFSFDPAVAIKRFNPLRKKGEEEFLNEIELLSRFNHPYIISLLGYCYQEPEMIHIYEYALEGSLKEILLNTEQVFPWANLLYMCVQTARGLKYLLAVEDQPRIFRPDINCANIYSGWRGAKLSPMRLLKAVPLNGPVHKISPTQGYVDLQNMEKGVSSKKESDVYWFGVVLLEVFCSVLTKGTIQAHDEQLASIAGKWSEGESLSKILDRSLDIQVSGNYSISNYEIREKSFETFSKLIDKCLKVDPVNRPTMGEVVIELELAYHFQLASGNNMPQPVNPELVQIPLEEILLATDHFREKPIGEGGFGKVYKAKLLSFPDEESVAIKRSNAQGSQGKHEFLNEIELLSRFNHPNLISLLGFCSEGYEMILVYEFASNGSLEELLLSKMDLPWVRRLQICLDAASGLKYLHNGVGDQHRIIHRDIKCANILLDKHWQAKISDLGLSRAVPLSRPVSHIVSYNVAGTQGYVDPQYMETGVLKKESDVYSFGVVLLEVFCRELTNDSIRAHDEQLASVARKWSNQGKLTKILDPALVDKISDSYSIRNDGINQKSLDAFSNIIDKCLKVKQVERPTMGEVVSELEQALRLQLNGLDDIKISLEDINIATSNFCGDDYLLGPDYLSLYKGVVPCYRGRRTARIIHYKKRYIGSSKDESFLNELQFLLESSHENVISLLGFSNEEGKNIIVFEHTTVSIGDMLRKMSPVTNSYGKDGISWMHLLKICLGAARGLEYLQHYHGIIHRNINEETILLNENWDAKISFLQFMVTLEKGVFSTSTSEIAGSSGYIDPHYAKTGELSKNTDVYSFAVVLWVVLYGGSEMIPYFCNGYIIPPELDSYEELISFIEVTRPYMLKQIALDSLKTFTKVASDCLQYHPKDRPTIQLVVEELEKALILQENHEWEPKLPKAYKEIIKMAKSPVVYSNVKELYYILFSGILLNNGHWFSLSEQGENCEMVPGTSFCCQKRIALRKSRLPKVAKMLDLSNLNLHINLKPNFLSLGITYSAYLVFKFCNRKKITTGPIYVQLKYILGTQAHSSVTYFAEWGNSGWMTVNLGHLTKANADFEVLLVSMSGYYCGRDAIYIEGIEFLPLENERLEPTITTSDIVVPDFHSDMHQQMLNAHEDLIKRSTEHVRSANNRELHDLLYAGIPIDNGKKFFFLSNLDGKKCHMLPLEDVLHKSFNKNMLEGKCIPKYRFDKCYEIQSYHEFRLKCSIETEMLSRNTTYACYLVYKVSEQCEGLLCPVKAKNLLPTKKNRKQANYVYLRAPNPVNALRSITSPVSRKDGWMEVKVWEFNSQAAHKRRYHPLHLKLICLEGNMSGLILCGLEFRPK